MRHDPEQLRFEHETAHGTSYLTYDRDPVGIDITYTFVPPADRGGGTGARLVLHARDWAWREGLGVTASCGFAAQVLHRHP